MQQEVSCEKTIDAYKEVLKELGKKVPDLPGHDRPRVAALLLLAVEVEAGLRFIASAVQNKNMR